MPESDSQSTADLFFKAQDAAIQFITDLHKIGTELLAEEGNRLFATKETKPALELEQKAKWFDELVIFFSEIDYYKPGSTHLLQQIQNNVLNARNSLTRLTEFLSRNYTDDEFIDDAGVIDFAIELLRPKPGTTNWPPENQVRK